MMVNSKKTQMLCINACKHNNVSSYIETEGDKIASTNGLKLLGFNFDCRPNANGHVELLIEKFYSRLWTIRFLKRSGLGEEKLLEVYNSVIRSAVEYCAVIYHSMIPASLSNKLEGIQRQALHIIYGWDVEITDVMKIKNIETLEERRKKAVLNFALKNESKERFGKRWFTEVNDSRQRRTHNYIKYRVPFCKTERMKSNPIVHMTRVLNEHYSK